MKDPGECIFQAFKEPKIQSFGNYGATSMIYWVYYKVFVLSYSEVGTYIVGGKFVYSVLKNDVFKIIKESRLL